MTDGVEIGQGGCSACSLRIIYGPDHVQEESDSSATPTWGDNKASGNHSDLNSWI